MTTMAEPFVDLAIVIIIGLSSGTIVSTLAWPLFDRGTSSPAAERSQGRVLVGMIFMAAGLIGLMAAPRLQQLNTIAAAVWQNAGFGYLFSIFWILPILYGRAAFAESWVIFGKKWREFLMYACIADTVAMLFVVGIQGATWASAVALSLAMSGIAAVRFTACTSDTDSISGSRL